MIDLVDIAMTSGATPSRPLPTLLSPALPMFMAEGGGAMDMTETFLGEVAIDEAADEFGRPDDDIRGPRLPRPHRGLLGTGFLKR
jgi:hypothetical protein